MNKIFFHVFILSFNLLSIRVVSKLFMVGCLRVTIKVILVPVL